MGVTLMLSFNMRALRLRAMKLRAIRLGAIRLGAIRLGAIRLGAIRLGIIVWFGLLIIAAKPHAALSQNILPLSGQHFTFSIIEGPDNLSTSSGLDKSQLTLSIVSTHSGYAVLTSANGYKKCVSFTSGGVTNIDLDYDLMLLNDLGKSTKGLTLYASQPCTCMLHDYLKEAGDATQLLPDDAMDTSYVVATTGIYNDPGEDNHVEFVVTAISDNTTVTIVPSVSAKGGIVGGVPITVLLNRSECYIVKADDNSVPLTTTLNGSTVRSDKPVSVITGTTCAYVPLGLESCNEVMDELIPKRAWGSEFYMQPMSTVNNPDVAFFTSDVMNYTLSVAGGVTYFTNNGRVQLQVSSPLHIKTTVPVQCHLFSQGSDAAFGQLSDPSMVTVLPIDRYNDTLLWATPNQPFLNNYISVIFPTSSLSQILLDGIGLSFRGTVTAIPNSPMSAFIGEVNPGRHFITSPQPIFGIASGFDVADAYTFGTGSVAPAVPEVLISKAVHFEELDTAVLCQEFSIDVKSDSAFAASDNIVALQFNVQYDPTALQLRGLTKNPLLAGTVITVDTTTAGTVKLTATGSIQGNAGSLFTLRFLAIAPNPSVTNLQSSFTITSGGDCAPAVATNSPTSLVVNTVQHIDREFVTFSLDAGSTVFGNIDTATIRIGTLSKNSSVQRVVFLLRYDHDVLKYVSIDQTASLTQGWTVAETNIDAQTDQFIFTSKTDSLSGPGIIAKIFFKSYVSDSAIKPMTLTSTLSSTRFCALDVLASDTMSYFVGRDLCGDGLLHDLLSKRSIGIESIIPNPTSHTFVVVLHSPTEATATLSLYSLLGEEVWTNTTHLTGSGSERVVCSIPTSVASGSYILRAASSGGVSSRLINIESGLK
jgi:hypothetical protein